jgi:hypothetical protein
MLSRACESHAEGCRTKSIVQSGNPYINSQTYILEIGVFQSRCTFAMHGSPSPGSEKLVKKKKKVKDCDW